MYVCMFISDVSSEYHVFRKKYSALVDTLKTTDLYRYFVMEEIITLAENDEISAETNSIKKIEIFLRKISSPLQNGHTRSFYVMLEVMASYGNRATKDLSRDINKILHSSVSDDDGKIYPLYLNAVVVICACVCITHFLWYICCIPTYLFMYKCSFVQVKDFITA